jgi:hypothetical protein
MRLNGRAGTFADIVVTGILSVLLASLTTKKKDVELVERGTGRSVFIHYTFPSPEGFQTGFTIGNSCRNVLSRLSNFITERNRKGNLLVPSGLSTNLSFLKGIPEKKSASVFFLKRSI